MHAANQMPTTVGFVIATPESTIAQDSNLLAHSGITQEEFSELSCPVSLCT